LAQAVKDIYIYFNSKQNPKYSPKNTFTEKKTKKIVSIKIHLVKELVMTESHI